MINDEKEPFCRTSVFDQVTFIMKIVLITLLYESFIENLSNYFPNQVIHVRKQDVSNIKRIRFDYDYSGIHLANSMAIDLSILAFLCKINYNTIGLLNLISYTLYIHFRS